MVSYWAHHLVSLSKSSLFLEWNPLAGTYPLSMVYSSPLSSVLLFKVVLEGGAGSCYLWILLNSISFPLREISPLLALKDTPFFLPLLNRYLIFSQVIKCLQRTEGEIVFLYFLKHKTPWGKGAVFLVWGRLQSHREQTQVLISIRNPATLVQVFWWQQQPHSCFCPLQPVHFASVSDTINRQDSRGFRKCPFFCCVLFFLYYCCQTFCRFSFLCLWTVSQADPLASPVLSSIRTLLFQWLGNPAQSNIKLC